MGLAEGETRWRDSGAEVTPTGPSGNKNLLNFLAYTVNCFSYRPET